MEWKMKQCGNKVPPTIVGGASSSPDREQDAPATLERQDDPAKVGGASSSLGREQDAPAAFGRQDAPAAMWEYFNPRSEIDIRTSGNLPHWEQGAVWYFVTFRLADAIPAAVAEQLQRDRERWLKMHAANHLSGEDAEEYHRLFNERYETLLNAGSGSCLLRDLGNAEIVREALRHFAGDRYDLDEYVVMPNHVHVLVKPRNGHGLADILHSWKSFTATQINRRMKRTGPLWQHESYDHIVRNEMAMEAIRRYIRDNPISKVGGASSSLGREQDAPATLGRQDVPAKVGGASSSLGREQDSPATLREQNPARWQTP